MAELAWPFHGPVVQLELSFFFSSSIHMQLGLPTLLRRSNISTEYYYQYSVLDFLAWFGIDSQAQGCLKNENFF